MTKPFIASMTIDGSLPSMKNQRRLVRNRRTGKPMSIKSQEAMDYEKSFLLQIPAKYRKNYEGPVSLRVRVWYRSALSDLDTAFLRDLLQKAEIIKNDRQIMHVDEFKDRDKENPRVVFTVYPWEEES